MLTIKHQGRMSLSEIRRRGIFTSFVVCRDERSQYCIVGSSSLMFEDFRKSSFVAEKEEKNHPMKSVMNVYSRGRLQPTHNDTFTRTQHYFRVIDPALLQENKYVDTYLACHI